MEVFLEEARLQLRLKERERFGEMLTSVSSVGMCWTNLKGSTIIIFIFQIRKWKAR